MKTDSIISQQTTDLNNICNIYQQWSQLEDPTHKLARITAILPFVSLAGILLKQNPDNEILQNIRNDFKKYYEQNHPRKLEWESSDFNKALIDKLAQLSTEGGSITPDLLKELFSYQDKYKHAHFVASFNLVDVLDDIQLDDSLDINKITTSIRQRLEKEFEKPDDLERHALLNQLSSFLQDLQENKRIISDSEKTKEYITEQKTFTKNTSTQVARPINEKNPTEIKAGPAIIKSGIEVEFSSANSQLSGPKNIYQQIAFLKQISADYEARRQMALKYKKTPLPEINWQNIIPPVPESLLSDGPNASESYLNQATFNLITKILHNNFSGTKKADIENTVATMLPQEALAFLLLFGETNQSDINFQFDGIQQNIEEVYNLIKNKQFYAKTVDMIQALEADLFIGKINEEKLAKLPEKFQELNYWSNFVGWPITQINQQVNFSFTDRNSNKDLIDYQIEGDPNNLKATISGVGAEILKTIQSSLQKLDKEYDIFRDGSEIAVALDAKKSGSPEFFAQQVKEFEKHHQGASAFTIHKQVAGKSVEIRVSKINNDTIIEVRMLGTNPHNPIKSLGQHDYPLLQEIIATINNDVQARLTELQKSPKEYDKLLKKRVDIIDGKIKEIPPIPREKGKPGSAVTLTQSIERFFVKGAVSVASRLAGRS